MENRAYPIITLLFSSTPDATSPLTSIFSIMSAGRFTETLNTAVGPSKDTLICQLWEFVLVHVLSL